MDIQGMQDQAATSALKGALDTQKEVTSKLITSTVDRLHSGMDGMTPMIEKDYQMQKDLLNAAYADKGIGTRLNTVG